MLKYQGHIFDGGEALCSCCVVDKKVVVVDPTGTNKLRSAFNSQVAIKWRGARLLTRKALIDQDLLSLTTTGLMAMVDGIGKDDEDGAGAECSRCAAGSIL